jgi:hypothetical protein
LAKLRIYGFLMLFIVKQQFPPLQKNEQKKVKIDKIATKPMIHSPCIRVSIRTFEHLDPFCGNRKLQSRLPLTKSAAVESFQ